MNKKRALTLIDLLVTLSIILILFLSAIPAYRSATRKSEIELVAYAIASQINLARNYAQYPSADENGNVAGYCFEYDKLNHKIVTAKVENIMDMNTNCSKGSIINSQQIPQTVSIQCTQCRAGFSARAGNDGKPIFGGDSTYIIGSTQSGYSQTVKLYNNGGTDVGT